MNEPVAKKGDVNGLGCGVLVMFAALSIILYQFYRKIDDKINALDVRVEELRQKVEAK